MSVEETERESIDKGELEKSGYLSKKTSKGLWVNRYFSTSRNLFQYWHSKEDSLNSDSRTCEPIPPSEVYDLTEVTAIEIAGIKGIQLLFMHTSKFKVELNAANEQERNDWFAFLQAKRRLYSVDELLTDLSKDQIVFRTETLKLLLLFAEKDQNKWILDRLDESFEISDNSDRSNKLRSNSSKLISAAIFALDEFIILCNDCALELSSRHPKLTAHIKKFMRRYAEILKGRLTLELLYLPGIDSRNFEALGIKAICKGMELHRRLNIIDQQFDFVPKILLEAMNQSVFSFGDIISSMLNLSIKRVEAFLESVDSSVASNRPKKLLDFPAVLLESVSLLKEDLQDQDLFKMVAEKVVNTQILTLIDLFNDIKNEDYDEIVLVDHIRACQKLATSLKNPDQTIIPVSISSSICEALNCTIESSCRQAIIATIRKARERKLHLMTGIFMESADGWIGGILCGAFVNSIAQWSDYLKEQLPSSYRGYIITEISKALIFMYLPHCFELYRNKRSYSKLSSKGMDQFRSDLHLILDWIHASKMVDIDACKGFDVGEEELLRLTISFTRCSEENALPTFANGIRLFGLDRCWELYDLLRFVLKINNTLQDRSRKHILGLCFEYIFHLRQVYAQENGIAASVAGTSDRLGQSHPLQRGAFPISPLEDLFPLAGKEHCTGKKWKMERLPDLKAVKLNIRLQVTETMNQALALRRPTASNPSTPTASSNYSDMAIDIQADAKLSGVAVAVASLAEQPPQPLPVEAVRRLVVTKPAEEPATAAQLSTVTLKPSFSSPPTSSSSPSTSISLSYPLKSNEISYASDVASQQVDVARVSAVPKKPQRRQSAPAITPELLSQNNYKPFRPPPPPPPPLAPPPASAVADDSNSKVNSNSSSNSLGTAPVGSSSSGLSLLFPKVVSTEQETVGSNNNNDDDDDVVRVIEGSSGTTEKPHSDSTTIAPPIGDIPDALRMANKGPKDGTAKPPPPPLPPQRRNTMPPSLSQAHQNASSLTAQAPAPNDALAILLQRAQRKLDDSLANNA